MEESDFFIRELNKVLASAAPAIEEEIKADPGKRVDSTRNEEDEEAGPENIKLLPKKENDGSFISGDKSREEFNKSRLESSPELAKAKSKINASSMKK